ncbi:FMN-dependent NADH-azoreductase [Mycoplasma phocimorsus]|uniref:FMN-dependent NADH-azoreductase n=1 Tax=Mycoplasma phocimorsus TaxID=3045839 RepID=UPI0024BFAC4E|nr:FMN-dependent NADH-azoreductase [Mycoplasma phocimorsus]MDJ1646751.1 FMN-dependent NADH-azoreductase [Mycoplasma phocimorsus]
MKKVLVLRTSVNANSITDTLTNEFLKIYTAKNPADQIIELDLNSENLIPLTKNNIGEYFSSLKADKYIELLKSVDKVIVTAPMYNFNVPATLKIFFDMIAQAQKTFTYKADGAHGLLTHISAQIISSQGAPIGWYDWADTTVWTSKMCEFLGINVTGIIKFAGSKVAGFNFEEVNWSKEVEKDALAF